MAHCYYVPAHDRVLLRMRKLGKTCRQIAEKIPHSAKSIRNRIDRRISKIETYPIGDEWRRIAYRRGPAKGKFLVLN